MHINAKHYSFKLNQATQNTYCVFIPKRSKMLSKQHFGNVLTFPRISPTRSSMRNCERKVIGHLKILSGHVKFWNYVPDGHVLLGSKCWALCFRSLDGFGCPGLWDFSKTGFRSPAFPKIGKGSHSRAAHPHMKPDWVPLPPPPPSAITMLPCACWLVTECKLMDSKLAKHKIFFTKPLSQMHHTCVLGDNGMISIWPDYCGILNMSVRHSHSTILYQTF